MNSSKYNRGGCCKGFFFEIPIWEMMVYICKEKIIDSNHNQLIVDSNRVVSSRYQPLDLNNINMCNWKPLDPKIWVKLFNIYSYHNNLNAEIASGKLKITEHEGNHFIILTQETLFSSCYFFFVEVDEIEVPSNDSFA